MSTSIITTSGTCFIRSMLLSQWLMAQRTANAQNGATLRSVYQALSLTFKIYYCLVIQGLPEFFEDHLEQWMRHTLTLLTDDDNPLLESVMLAYSYRSRCTFTPYVRCVFCAL